MDTPLSAPVTRNKSMLDAVLGSYPIPRLGSPDEVAVVIDWLLDEDSSWVTGQIISVDGGFSALRGSAHSRASNNGNTLAPGSVLEASKA
jgi:NAD(P)-dependent dehydrogenase (short-subunit alcohol dehydrogenase family)